MLRGVAGVVVALMLGACGQTTLQNGPFAPGSAARPETVIVADFAFSPDLVLQDRGFAAQLQRRMGKVTPEEMREQIARRVNHEIVTAMVETLREAGLDAGEGGEAAVVAEKAVLVVTGKVRTTDQGNRTQRGAGKSGLVADVAVTHQYFGAKKEALVFVAEAGSAPRPGGAVRAPAVPAVAGAGPEKLSADVQAGARRLGQAAARRIITFAAEQGWVAKSGT
jgi:hypothetical protein